MENLSVSGNSSLGSVEMKPGGTDVDQVGSNKDFEDDGKWYICNKPIYNNTIYAVTPGGSNWFTGDAINITNNGTCYLIIRTTYIYVYSQ